MRCGRLQAIMAQTTELLQPTNQRNGTRQCAGRRTPLTAAESSSGFARDFSWLFFASLLRNLQFVFKLALQGSSAKLHNDNNKFHFECYRLVACCGWFSHYLW